MILVITIIIIIIIINFIIIIIITNTTIFLSSFIITGDKMDIMFVLDVSNQTGKNIECQKTYLKKVIKMLHFGQSATRIGLITLSRLARTVSNLNDHLFVESLLHDVERQQLDSASTCDYYNAIWLLLTDSYTDTNGGRKNVPDVAVILTDNRPSERHLHIYKGIKRKATHRLREKGIKVYAVGVGNDIDTDELLQITGTERHYFHAGNCQELISEASVSRTYHYILKLGMVFILKWHCLRGVL